ncbi:MAG: chitobiase/beta-hexosaminidase C-terminal domain-containing protein, partial [Muribaculaceae bacterium]|nr:chitobiase/beta-hexosaminidase C-terminal domain-containing protein [Muribaculaceae bacterium]
MKKLLLSLALLPFMASAQNYVKTDITDLSTGDVVVIVDQTSNLALANDGGATKATRGKVVNVTLTDDKNEITFADAATAATGEFTIEVTGTDYKFNAGGSDYLYVISDNNGVCVGTGDDNTFTWTTDGYLKSKSNARYLGVYNNQNWRSYTSVNSNIRETVTAFYKKVMAPAAVKTPAFSVEAGTIDAGTEVAISCETEGANIYYTLDGTEPTSASTVYSAPIAINESCTLNAIAELNGDYSYIASATYTVVPVYATLDEVVKLENGVSFKYTGELSVTYVDGPYVYVYDPVSKVQSLIYKANLGLDKGQVIKGGWAGKVSIYQGLFEIVPDALEVVEGATATLPEAIKVTAQNVETYIATDYINNYMVLTGVELTEAINAKKSYTVTIGDKNVTIYNTFERVAEPGKYNIEGFLSNHTSGLQFVPVTFNELKPWAITTEYTCEYAILDLTLLTGNATIAEGEDVITLTLEGEETPLTSTRDLLVVNESDSHSPIVGYALDAKIDQSGFYTLHVPAGFFVNADGVGNEEYTETLELEGNVVWVTFPENGLRLITDAMETIGVIEQTEETVFSSDMQIGNDGEDTYFFLAQNCELEDLENQVYGSINPMDDVPEADQITAPLNNFANTEFPFMVKGGYYNVTVQWNSPNPVIIFTKTEKKADEMVMPEKLYLMGWYVNELTLEGKVFSAKNVSITSAKEKLYFNASGDEGDYEYGLADVNTTIAVGEAYTLVSKGEPFTIAAGKYDVTVDWNGSAPIVTFTEPANPASTMNIYWDNSDTNWIGTPIFIYANENAYEEIMPNKDLTPEGYYEYTIPT